MCDPEMIKKMGFYCFHTIISILTESKIPEYPSEFPKNNSPLFVTWQKKVANKNEETLRGCIGTFSSKPLKENLSKYAIISAFKDERFSPIKLKEIPHLTCTVSLLHTFEEVKSCFDWEIGKHGISIEFTVGKIPFSATFLPEVAKEENWDKETTLEYLIEKAGYEGNHKTILNKIKLTRYQSSLVTTDYEAYSTFLKSNPKFFTLITFNTKSLFIEQDSNSDEDNNKEDSQENQDDQIEDKKETTEEKKVKDK